MSKAQELTRRESEVVNAALTSKTAGEISAKTGIPLPTVYRYLKKPQVREAIQRANRELINNTLRYFAYLGGKAINNIEALLESKYERIRLEASKYVLDVILRLKELQELEQRIEALEQAVQEQKGG